MRYKDDEPIECEICGKTIYAGDYYYYSDRRCFCNMECVAEHLLAKYHESIQEEYLMTAKDKETEHGDISYEQHY